MRQGTLHTKQIYLSHVKTRCSCWYSLRNQLDQDFSTTILRLKQQSNPIQAIHVFQTLQHATQPLSAILNPWSLTHQFYRFCWGKIWTCKCMLSCKAQVLVRLNPWLPLLAPHKIGYQEVELPAPDTASFTTSNGKCEALMIFFRVGWILVTQKDSRKLMWLPESLKIRVYFGVVHHGTSISNILLHSLGKSCKPRCSASPRPRERANTSAAIRCWWITCLLSNVGGSW